MFERGAECGDGDACNLGPGELDSGTCGGVDAAGGGSTPSDTASGGTTLPTDGGNFYAGGVRPGAAGCACASDAECDSGVCHAASYAAPACAEACDGTCPAVDDRAAVVTRSERQQS